MDIDDNTFEIIDHDKQLIRITGNEGRVTTTIQQLAYVLQEFGPFRMDIDFKNWKGITGL